MSENPYRLSDAARKAARDMVVGHEGNIDRIYLDNHAPRIPTIGVGISLADKNRRPWPNMDEILRGQGIDPDAIVAGDQYHGKRTGDAVTRSIDDYAGDKSKAGFEAWYAAPKGQSPFKNPPPLGITLPAAQAEAALMPVLDRAGGAIRDKFGRDASGAYHFDKLQPDEQAALVDAYHNAPGLVGRGVTEAIRDGDYMKAFWEMKENVKDPFNPRRMDDARPFLANHSPVENLFNSDSYTTGVLNKAGEEISRAMAGSGDGNGSAPDVTSPAWKESPNMFNSDSYRANMLNASEEELHKAGY